MTQNTWPEEFHLVEVTKAHLLNWWEVQENQKLKDSALTMSK